jgi:hypothetical protein
LAEAEREAATAEPADKIKARAEGWSHQGAGEGLLAAAGNIDRLAEDATQRRLAATGLAGTLDRLLTTLSPTGRKTARQLLESWADQKIDDAELAASTAALAGRRPR